MCRLIRHHVHCLLLDRGLALRNNSLLKISSSRMSRMNGPCQDSSPLHLVDHDVAAGCEWSNSAFVTCRFLSTFAPASTRRANISATYMQVSNIFTGCTLSTNKIGELLCHDKRIDCHMKLRSLMLAHNMSKVVVWIGIFTKPSDTQTRLSKWSN